jgi:hypothetical protein
MHLEVVIAHLPTPISLVVVAELNFISLASQSVEHKLLPHDAVSEAADMSMFAIKITCH